MHSETSIILLFFGTEDSKISNGYFVGSTTIATVGLFMQGDILSPLWIFSTPERGEQLRD